MPPWIFVSPLARYPSVLVVKYLHHLYSLCSSFCIQHYIFNNHNPASSENRAYIYGFFSIVEERKWRGKKKAGLAQIVFSSNVGREKIERKKTLFWTYFAHTICTNNWLLLYKIITYPDKKIDYLLVVTYLTLKKRQ